MFVPNVEKHPAFNITRASHVRYLVKDLDRSLHFYTEVIGLVLSEREGEVAYLRGIEEACHHSVVLIQSDEAPAVECLGMRVASEEDLHRAEEYFSAAGGTAELIQREHQGPTLLTSFGPGTPPIELVTSMPVLPRMLNNFPAQKGGRALRFSHYQCAVPDAAATASKFMALGFRTAKYTTDADNPDQVLSIFLTRKGDPHDLVLATASGPRLHHCAYVVSDLQAMMRAADIAGNLGYGRDVEHGPGRHGPPNGVFLYLRDPDGHRIEFILPPIQFIDPEDVPNAWDSNDGVSLVPWGSGPPDRWRAEMARFAGIEPSDGAVARWTALGARTAPASG